MEFKHIKELIALINSTDITDLEIEDGDFQLRISKKQATVSAPVQVAEAPASAPQVVVPETPSEIGYGFVEITAPMVGTFYRAPAPDADPYVQVGDSVSTGQVLFIIEAMKMMNEIESEMKGVVKQILVENGEPVEYGQPLLLIDPQA